jgi:sigma-B regulation protein RsbU (phosphoserine phosphatase)
MLRPGDRVLVFTDGLTECCDAKGLQLGLQPLLQLAAILNGGSPDQLAEGMVQEALRHADKTPITDDLTLFVLEYRADGGDDGDGGDQPQAL